MNDINKIQHQATAQQDRMTERLLRLPEVEQRCGMKKTAIYASIKRGSFPQSVQIGPRSIAWPETRVTAWIAEKVEAKSGKSA